MAGLTQEEILKRLLAEGFGVEQIRAAEQRIKNEFVKAVSYRDEKMLDIDNVPHGILILHMLRFVLDNRNLELNFTDMLIGTCLSIKGTSDEREKPEYDNIIFLGMINLMTGNNAVVCNLIREILNAVPFPESTLTDEQNRIIDDLFTKAVSFTRAWARALEVFASIRINFETVGHDVLVTKITGEPDKRITGSLEIIVNRGLLKDNGIKSADIAVNTVVPILRQQLKELYEIETDGTIKIKYLNAIIVLLKRAEQHNAENTELIEDIQRLAQDAMVLLQKEQAILAAMPKPPKPQRPSAWPAAIARRPKIGAN